MKLKGEFMMRELLGDTILIPIGETALTYNGIIWLDPVGAEIWRWILQGASKEQLLENMIQNFEVEEETAKQDLENFLEDLRRNGFVD